MINRELIHSRKVLSENKRMREELQERKIRVDQIIKAANQVCQYILQSGAVEQEDSIDIEIIDPDARQNTPRMNMTKQLS